MYIVDCIIPRLATTLVHHVTPILYIHTPFQACTMLFTAPPPSHSQVRDFFQMVFHNFLAYMVHLINEDLNIDIVFARDCEKATLDLFIQLMELLPKLPKLAEVKAYNNTWSTQQERITTPSFPFFRRVADIMDELLERSVEEMQKIKKPLAEASIDADSDSKCA